MGTASDGIIGTGTGAAACIIAILGGLGFGEGVEPTVWGQGNLLSR